METSALFFYSERMPLCMLSDISSLPDERCQKQADEDVKNLFRQGKRYQRAAEQDRAPSFAALHNSYAVGYFEALEMATSPEGLERILGNKFRVWKQRALRFQRKVEDRFLKMMGSRR